MPEGTKMNRYLLIAMVLAVVVFCASSVFGGFTLVSAGIYNAIIQMTPGESIVVGQVESESTEMPFVETDVPVVPSLQPEVTGTSEEPEVISNTPTAITNADTQAPSAEPTTTPAGLNLPTDTPEPTATEIPTETPTITLVPPTPDPTSQAMPMVSFVEQLYEAGTISSTEGRYYVIEDFENNWSDTKTYEKTYSGFESTDFVLRANLTWQVANTNLGVDSGCGIIFHENEEGDHYLLVFTLGDRAILYKRIAGSLINLGASYRYDVDNEIAQAQIMLSVEDNDIHVYVEGKELYGKKFPSLDSGKLAFTVISGSSVDYGTRCEMRDIELWEIEK